VDASDICPYTDRARVLLDAYAGLDLHQLRHSAATHACEAVPLQLIMGVPLAGRRSGHAERHRRGDVDCGRRTGSRACA
jgi:hypothetical protein